MACATKEKTGMGIEQYELKMAMENAASTTTTTTPEPETTSFPDFIITLRQKPRVTLEQLRQRKRNRKTVHIKTPGDVLQKWKPAAEVKIEDIRDTESLSSRFRKVLRNYWERKAAQPARNKREAKEDHMKRSQLPSWSFNHLPMVEGWDCAAPKHVRRMAFAPGDNCNIKTRVKEAKRGRQRLA